MLTYLFKWILSIRFTITWDYYVQITTDCMYLLQQDHLLVKSCLSFPLIGGPSSVQYQHGTPALYQGQSGSPPPTGLPRVSIPTNQQAASARPTVPLAQGVPQQQQVIARANYILFLSFFSLLRVK